MQVFRRYYIMEEDVFRKIFKARFLQKDDKYFDKYGKEFSKYEIEDFCNKEIESLIENCYVNQMVFSSSFKM